MSISSTLWLKIRYSTTYYHLSNIPKFYRQFSLPGFKITNGTLDTEPLFIMACGRSGNTLLRAILCSNDEVVIPPESYILGNIYDKFKIFNHLRWETLVKIVFGELESHPDFKDWKINLQPLYKIAFAFTKEERTLDRLIDTIYWYYGEQHFPKARFWGDKTPENNLWLNKIRKIFPRARYVFLYRDGRDVVSSFLKAGLLNDLERACHYWNLNMNLSESFLSKTPADQFMRVKYEELVEEPETEIKKICAYLGIEYSTKMLHPYRISERLGDVSEHEHHANVKRPISNSSIGKWKNYLNEQQQVLAEHIMKQNLSKYGYFNF